MSIFKKIKHKLTHLFIPGTSNNQRPRILHPAGLSVIVGIFLLNFAFQQLVDALPGFILGFSSSVTVEEVINLTNQERIKAGLQPLSHNPSLSQAAIGKASDMFTRDYWAHVSPTGTQPWDFIKNAGYKYKYAGENLARDFSDTSSVINAWLNSPSHRENLLNSKYTDIGVAVVDGTLQGVETRLVVQMFGSPTPVPIAQAPKPVPAKKTVIQQQAAQTQPQPEVVKEEVKQEPEPVVEPEQVQELEQTEFGTVTDQEPRAQYAGTKLVQTIVNPDKREVLVSPTQVTQTFGAILVMLILGTLVVDWVIAHRRRTVRLVGKNWAHLTFLGAITLMMLQYAQGRIL